MCVLSLIFERERKRLYGQNILQPFVLVRREKNEAHNIVHLEIAKFPVQKLNKPP
jgi:hypothetical protein